LFSWLTILLLTILARSFYHVSHPSITPNTQRKRNDADITLNAAFVLKIRWPLTNVTG